MGPLDGIRIIDWTHWQQGPVATVMLGDLGAEVIKLEERVIGEWGRRHTRTRGGPSGLPAGRTTYFEYLSHNKKSITVDLKKDAGREIVYRLAAKSDVFVQNRRPGVTAQLGIDYNTLSKYNPKLIYANASGYGPEGPERMRPGFDPIAQARSGIMFQSGAPGTPPNETGWGLCDQASGIMLAFGVVTALYARELHGVGQEIDVSLLGSTISLLGLSVAHSTLLGTKFNRQIPGSYNPLFNYHRCKDDRWIMLSHPAPDPYWEPLCNALGIPELVNDPRFHNSEARKTNSAELIAILSDIFATKTYDEWAKFLNEKGDFIFDIIQDVADLASDPQVIANEYIAEFDHPVLGKIKLPGLPMRFSKTHPSKVLRLPAPDLGEHNEEVLWEICGYSPEEIAGLKEEQII